MTRFSNQLKMLVASNKTYEALSILSEVLTGRDEITRNDVILLQARYNQTQSNLQKGLMSYKKASRQFTLIDNATLSLLIDFDTLLDNQTAEELFYKYFPPKIQMSNVNFSTFLIALYVLGYVMTFSYFVMIYNKMPKTIIPKTVPKTEIKVQFAPKKPVALIEYKVPKALFI